MAGLEDLPHGVRILIHNVLAARGENRRGAEILLKRADAGYRRPWITNYAVEAIRDIPKDDYNAWFAMEHRLRQKLIEAAAGPETPPLKIERIDLFP